MVDTTDLKFVFTYEVSVQVRQWVSPFRLEVRTLLLHSSDTGSNPVRVDGGRSSIGRICELHSRGYWFNPNRLQKEGGDGM
jgi:hypothetical protein